ncbi:MAG: BatD family protein [Luteolibacter sp.]|uniref:BatD family protein n=1 Tax=Luteolibacter sp. TaxID=1962973 RepID=UPI003265C31E
MVTSLHRGNGLPGIAKAIATCFLTILFSASFAAAAEVEAALDRESVPAGNGAVLTLTISGGRAGQPVIPAVDKLIVQPRGQSQQMRMFNGTTTVSVTYNYVVGSNTPGDYVIPALSVTVDGKEYSTQPLKLKVLDSGAAQPPPGMPPANPNAQQAEPPQEETGEKRFGFLTVELADNARKHAYVGEIAPVRIRAWLPADSRARLRSGIQPEGKAFTLHNVSGQPQQTEEIKDGKRYLVVTWYGGISATKAGKYPASLSLDATVAVRDTSAPKPRRQMGGPFDDPFFNSMFDNINVPMIQKDVTLKSEDQEIEVLPLPTEGRPAGFTGAVGKFKLDAYEIPAEWKTGEPQQITAQINGSGNFSLVNAPDLTPSGAWKSYPGKSDFTPSDEASFSGTKSFRFSAVPRKGGEQEAALAFSYFDPDAAAYKTLTTAPKKIQVTGKDIAEDVAVAPPAPEKKIEKKAVGLVGQHTKQAPGATLVPLVERPAFMKLLGFAVVLAIFGRLLGWFRVRRSDPQRIARMAMEKATREALEAAGKCAASKDVTGFFAASRLAIQHRLGALWNQPAQAITSAEVQSRVPADSPVARFFSEADRHEYSRQSTGEILPGWRTLLDEAMASLTPSAR